MLKLGTLDTIPPPSLKEFHELITPITPMDKETPPSLYIYCVAKSSKSNHYYYKTLTTDEIGKDCSTETQGHVQHFETPIKLSFFNVVALADESLRNFKKDNLKKRNIRSLKDEEIKTNFLETEKLSKEVFYSLINISQNTESKKFIFKETDKTLTKIKKIFNLILSSFCVFIRVSSTKSVIGFTGKLFISTCTYGKKVAREYNHINEIYRQALVKETCKRLEDGMASLSQENKYIKKAKKMVRKISYALTPYQKLNLTKIQADAGKWLTENETNRNNSGYSEGLAKVKVLKETLEAITKKPMGEEEGEHS
jgi:hypothetical protein